MDLVLELIAEIYRMHKKDLPATTEQPKEHKIIKVITKKDSGKHNNLKDNALKDA